jgi:hypothetical protein
MTVTPIKNAAGTQKERQQTRITQQCWTETNGVHFPDGRLTTLPSFSELTISSPKVPLDGVTRSIFAQKFDGSQVGTGWVFGTNNRIYAFKAGVFTNITPYAGETNVSLGNNPISLSSGSATMTVAVPAHGLTTSHYVTFSGIEEQDCVAVGVINARYKVASVATNTFTVTLPSVATHTHNNVGGAVASMRVSRPTITTGTNQLSLTSGSNVLTVNHTAHGLSVGDRISLMGASTFGGVDAATRINIEHLVATVPNANSFTIVLSASATSSATGGTGTAICTPIAAGNLNQGSAYGWGAGIWGAGIWGAPRFSNSSQSYPRIWSFGRFGSYVIATAGDYTAGDGQKIYMWDGDTSRAMFVMQDAPTDCNYVDVINNQVIAYCGAALKIGQTDPLTGFVDWNGYGYYENNMQNLWKCVSSCSYGDKTAVVFNPTRTPDFLSYVGGDDLWDVVEITGGEGIIAPMAFCTMNGGVYFMGASGQLYVFNGSSVERVKNEQNGDFVARDINEAQSWKVHMMADPYYNQVWVFYPSGNSMECDKYMIAHAAGHFTLGAIPRSATQRPSVIDGTYYMTSGDVIYSHYTGEESSHAWEAVSALQNFDAQNGRFGVSKLYMDGNQTGTANVNMYAAEYPRETPHDFGSDTVTSTTEYVSVKAAGKYIGYGFSGTSDFTLGDIALEVER